MTLPLVGVLEGIERTGDEIGLCGWVIAFDDAVIGFRIRLDQEEAVATLAQEREDLRAAFPAARARSFRGFSVRFATPARDPREPLPLEILVLGDGLRELGTIRFVHDPRLLDRPIPPAALRHRSTRTTDAAFWALAGAQTGQDLLRAWRLHDRRAGPLRALDFGCGVARLTPLLAAASGIGTCTGTDIDPDAIAWCRSALRGIDFRPTSPAGPLAFPDASFDLVIAYSVFTHLARVDQDRWLAELARVAAPDGHLILTTHGPSVLRLKAPELLPRLAEEGFLDRGPDPILDEVLPPGFYREVFHSPDFVRRDWSRHFEILDLLPGGAFGYQDIVVLRRA